MIKQDLSMYSSLCLQRTCGVQLISTIFPPHKRLIKKMNQKASVTCAWKEVVSIFMEGHSHDPVREVEGFLNTVAMVNVNINV